jgi:hypothetical protein
VLSSGEVRVVPWDGEDADGVKKISTSSSVRSRFSISSRTEGEARLERIRASARSRRACSRRPGYERIPGEGHGAAHW